MALTEYHFVSKTVQTQEEVDLLNGPPFSFYRVTLQYCFNSEYNKLLEAKSSVRYPEQHIASVYNLNTFLRNAEGEAFEKRYTENLLNLQLISSTEFSQKQRLLRDKKFSHSDDHEINDPLKIEGLSEQEVAKGFSALAVIFRVINNCALFFDYEYSVAVPYNDNRTENFIKFQATYRRFYFDHYLDALKKGYGNR